MQVFPIKQFDLKGQASPSPVLSGDRWISLTFERDHSGQYRLTKKGGVSRWSSGWKESKKRALATVLCFCLGLLLAICSIQGAGAGNRHAKEDQALTHFQPRVTRIWSGKEQEIKQFKWTIKAVANLRFVSSRVGNQEPARLQLWRNGEKLLRHTKAAQGDKWFSAYAAKQNRSRVQRKISELVVWTRAR